MLADYDVVWFEEALRRTRSRTSCELRRASPVPIAGGEVLTRRQSFLPWFVRGAFDIVQPDVTKVGGISEQRRIAWLADEFGVRYIGHGWNTAVGLAADLQLASAFPDTDLVEYIGGSPYVDGITRGGFMLEPRAISRFPTGRASASARSRRARPLHARSRHRSLRAETPAAPIVHEGVACAPPSPGARSPITNSCPSHNGQYTGGRNDDA